VPSYPLRVLVLRKTKLGEADLILTLLADDGRIVRAVAKGMRKPTSRFAGRLEPGSVADLILNTGRNLEIVSDARSVDLHAGLRQDYERSTAASVVVDVLDKIAVEGQGEERLFGLAQATLSAIEDAEDTERVRVVVTAFLLKAMAMHGYRPHLDSCVLCSCATPASGRAGFSFAAGGVMCTTCASAAGAGAVATLSKRGSELLAWMLKSTMSEVAEAEPASEVVGECFGLVRAFVGYHLPARMRALDFYAKGAGA